MRIYIKKISILFLLLAGLLAAPAQPSTHEALLNELQLLQKQIVPDKRVAILDIALKDSSQSKVVVTGETNLPEAKAQIIQYLDNKSISYVDSIRILPDSVIGNKTWGLIVLSVANMRAKPDDASELVSQAVMGTPVKVLDYQNKWYRIQTPEGYLGWLDANEIKTLSTNEMLQWKISNRYLFNRISGFVYDAPGKKGQVVSDVVLSNMFEVETTVKGFLKIRIPDGRTGFVKKTECISFDEWSNQKPDAGKVISIARQMMGFPYLWGGTSSKSMDCSGFVKVVFYSQGIIVARDASQQASYGKEIDFTNASNLETGDLLFFGRSTQRINHVGISLGGGDFIHSSGRVHISSIDSTDPKYVSTRNCVAAKRVFNSLNTKGVITVKNHPWYTNQP